uniref:RxLR effector candidate protein n=1 Tax=Hyaloperonospora arabidopsidis (strain Emoy2) TaxID=559515 RepID=M4B814_HYAAE
MLNYSLLLVVILVVVANIDAVLPPAAHTLRHSTSPNQVQTVKSPVNSKQAVESNKVTRDATVEERAATCLSSLHEWLTASLKIAHSLLAWMGEVAKVFWEKVKAVWKTEESAISKKSKAAWLKQEAADLELWGDAPKRKEEAADSKKSEAALRRKQEGVVLNKAAAAPIEEEPFGWSKAGRWWEGDGWMKNDVSWEKKRPTAEELAKWDIDFEQMKKEGVTSEAYKQRLFDEGKIYKIGYDYYEEEAWKTLDWYFFGWGYAQYRRYKIFLNEVDDY